MRHGSTRTILPLAVNRTTATLCGGLARHSLPLLLAILMMTPGVSIPEDRSSDASDRRRLSGQWRLDPHEGDSNHEKRRAMREAMGPFEVARVVSITQTEPEVIILEEDGVLRGRTLRPDGRKYRVEANDTEIRARWDKQRLVVETSHADGSRVIETFGIAADRRRLVVDVRFDGPVSAEMRLMYEPAPALHPLHGLSRP